MKFGIFYELSVPRPWDDESERRVYITRLEQVELADQLGFDYVWAVEHHFTEEYSHCSAPELFLTACAIRTKRIHVGHGIVVCVPQFNHPIKIAERAAVLDILSGAGSRLARTFRDLGRVGRLPRPTPTTPRRAGMNSSIVCPKCGPRNVTPTMDSSGRCRSGPILPKPYQKPHPRMWVAVTSAGTELDAADRGPGMLGLSYGSIADQEKKLVEYKRRIKNCTPAGEIVNDQASAMTFMYCHEDDDTAIREGTPIYTTYNALTNMFVDGARGAADQVVSFARSVGDARAQIGAAPLDNRVPEGVLVGDPHRILNTVKRYESAGFDSVNFLLTGIENTPQEKILASLKTVRQRSDAAFPRNRTARGR